MNKFECKSVRLCRFLYALGFDKESKFREDGTEYTDNELELFFKTFYNLQEYYGEYICISEYIHKLFHSIYGYGNNTKEQWDEFVNNYKKNKVA